MIRFFAAHPTAANLLMVLFLILGVVSLPDIKRETFPEIKKYTVEIKVPYPGAAPLDVEQGICLPLEDALDGISFIEEKVCSAQQNMGVMAVKMLEKSDFGKFLNDVKSAVDGINDFPKEAELATVMETGRTQKVSSVALTADLPRAELKNLAESLKQKLLQHPDIPLVEVQGFSERQLLIEVPDRSLRSLGMSLQELVQTLQKQDLDLPLGSIETVGQEVQLRFNDERRTADALANLIVFTGKQGNEVRLGDIATIRDTFELAEDKVSFNGKSTALLNIKKNTINDSLVVLSAVETVIAEQSQKLPEGVNLELTQDATSIVKDRITLLATNAWQGLLLVFAVMWLFFTFRYAFWVVMGLPVAFMASFFVLGHLGVTINMISMVALLLALGILMDDAIVISESIASQIRKGLKPLEAAVEGTKIVARGVLSSFATTLCIFVGLIFLEGNIGQVLKVIPVVLITVITVSLVEAFLILPAHLYHSLNHAGQSEPTPLRLAFEQKFEAFRQHVFNTVETLIKYRYAFIGSVIAVFFLSVSLLASGVLKFSAFPSIEGDLLEARIMMPAGTPLAKTEEVVQRLLTALDQSGQTLNANEKENLVKAVTVTYNTNADAGESGPHMATISVDLLTAEQRHTKIRQLINEWRANAGTIASAQTITFKEPAIGPSGRAIEIRLSGHDLEELSEAAEELQNWLRGYPGVENLMTDLRPGKPEYSLSLKPGALNLGIDAQTIANQTRAAFQGVKALETNVGLETFEVTVKLSPESRDEFQDFDSFPIIHPQTRAQVPLSTVADIEQTRGYSKVTRVNNLRTVTVYGDIDSKIGNTSAILSDVQKRWLKGFKQRNPDVSVSFEGEVKSGGTTQKSMMSAFALGLIGVFILLSFQFRSYVEPVIVMAAIPLALIGVIWGHFIMGLAFTMPSMLGFVSLAGIVVNDSILLVEFVKKLVAEGLTVHDAAAKASYDRFRAVFLTSVTTIAGMTPLLFETSLQAQVLIPLATSIVFGIAMSTLLVLFVIPCLYSILEDFGWATTQD
ncbi:AcrB/AcrD/AcrF family protein [Endozoicomonas sp. OPT23]|uniref:efflux RND transporter permease subunit n=1 Tax=Endozoicomonas sp. OPT23 TaxID=2072845 RepID=UPI00129AFAAB|nr:efflux RND transporter permease subunit [Endozoicomonas sp. OPT23]MRI33174.1 AcrB/AcrD/AcrF family protein [Endozoicomonas sp. OPT23]